MIWRANQWTGFYMIGTSVMQELNHLRGMFFLEAAEVFLKILQNSQENTCARVFFLTKLQTEHFYLEMLLFLSPPCRIFENL